MKRETVSGVHCLRSPPTLVHRGANDGIRRVLTGSPFRARLDLRYKVLSHDVIKSRQGDDSIMETYVPMFRPQDLRARFNI